VVVSFDELCKLLCLLSTKDASQSFCERLNSENVALIPYSRLLAQVRNPLVVLAKELPLSVLKSVDALSRQDKIHQDASPRMESEHSHEETPVSFDISYRVSHLLDLLTNL
jgi:hypothetical protein